jgi:hypothetical protein
MKGSRFAGVDFEDRGKRGPEFDVKMEPRSETIEVGRP